MWVSLNTAYWRNSVFEYYAFVGIHLQIICCFVKKQVFANRVFRSFFFVMPFTDIVSCRSQADIVSCRSLAVK